LLGKGDDDRSWTILELNAIRRFFLLCSASWAVKDLGDRRKDKRSGDMGGKINFVGKEDQIYDLVSEKGKFARKKEAPGML